MKEDNVIGGEYAISPGLLNGVEAYEDTIKYSLGRTCLYVILEGLKNSGRCDGGVLVPDYLCNSIVEVPDRLGIDIKHYHIDGLMQADYGTISDGLDTCQAIVLITYFGMISVEGIATRIRNDFPDRTIIIDDVQNYYHFGEHGNYDYCFTSLRKWFPVPDGAMLRQKDGVDALVRYENEGSYAAFKTAGNLLKTYRDSLGDEVALHMIDTGEEMMDYDYLHRASRISRILCGGLDRVGAGDIRRRNAKRLHMGLVKLGIEHVYDETATPLFVPIILEPDQRYGLRNALFKCRIFSPVHWPVENEKLQGSNDLYYRELSLICDQRYGDEDMDRILRCIESGL